MSNPEKSVSNLSESERLKSTHIGEVVGEGERSERLRAVFGYPCVRILLDRVNRNGIRDRLNESRVLRSDQDPEAVESRTSAPNRLQGGTGGRTY